MHCFSIMNTQEAEGLGQMCSEHMIVGNISRSDNNFSPKVNLEVFLCFNI